MYSAIQLPLLIKQYKKKKLMTLVTLIWISIDNAEKLFVSCKCSVSLILRQTINYNNPNEIKTQKIQHVSIAIRLYTFLSFLNCVALSDSQFGSASAS